MLLMISCIYYVSLFRSLAVPNMGNVFTLSITEARRQQNQFQNTVLNVLDTFASLGYTLISPQDLNNLILQKDSITSAQRGTYLLVEPNYANGYVLEIQGQIEESFLQTVVLPLGFSALRKVEDKGRVSVYQLEVPGMGGAFTMSMQEIRRRTNR